LRALPTVELNNKFQIFNNNLSTHLILGRDFFHDNNLTLVYKSIDIKQKETVELFKEVASTEIIDKPENELEFNNIKTDLGVEIER